MKFRPCIDIHNGKVKQIVGGSLKDLGDQAEENFISEKDAAFYAHCYQKDGLTGGHVILLIPKHHRIMKRRNARRCLHCHRQGEHCRSAAGSQRKMRRNF